MPLGLPGADLELLPDSPEQLGLAGYPEWRENQRETVGAILEAFQSHRVILVSAPTGAGKTIIGAAASRALGGSALYLAHTIILQEQQLRTLPEAVTVTGRRNHLCSLPVGKEFGLTADEADCPCDDFAVPGGCGYYKQWFDAMSAQDVVLNYAFMVRIVKARGIRVAPGAGTTGEGRNVIENPFLGRRLMVCDEGHNLEQALLDADMVELHQRSWERVGVELPRSVDFERFTEWASEVREDVEDQYASLARATSATGHMNLDTFKDRRRLKGLLQTLDSLDDLGKRHQRTPIHVGRKEHGYTLQPLWVWDRADHLLFRHAANTMVMSATLGAPGLTAKLLGLHEGGYEHISIPSTFPVQNRPVFYWPVAKMKHNMDQSEKARQIVALVELARKFQGTRGVVHCNSYSLGRYLALGVQHYDVPDVARRIVTHTAADREQVFKLFESGELGDDAILITPSATTGVDWDFVGWQMIPKVPYPDLSDDLVRLRYDYCTEEGDALGKEVYQQEACKTLVQAAGRNVRTPESVGVTVITDSAFWPLFKYMAPAAFPDWFRAAVSWYKPKVQKG